MKIASFLFTALINVGVGIVLFFMLIVGLNGFSGKQAEPGLILFFVWVLLTALVTAVLSVKAAKFFRVGKSLNAFLSALLAVLIFAVIGAAMNVVGLLAAVFLVSALR